MDSGSNQVKESSSVVDRLFREGYRFNFFQAVYLLEKLYQDAAGPGEEGPLSQESIRFQASSRLSFPPGDVYSIEKRDGKYIQGVTGRSEIVRMILSFMGLYGVDSPLPSYFSAIIAGLSDKEESDYKDGESGIRALRHFLDIFDHRIYSLFYRSWKKYRYYLQFEEGANDKFSQYMLSLLGLGTPALQDLVGVESSRLIAYTGIIGQQVHCAAGLRGLLFDYFDGIGVRIIEFMPRWVAVPERYRPRLGIDHSGTKACLSENVIIGGKVRDFSGKFRVALGPLNLEKFLRFIPGGADSQEFYRLVRFYAPDQLSFDVELLLRKEEVPPLQLGTGLAQLGWTSWLGKPRENVVSIVFSFDS